MRIATAVLLGALAAVFVSRASATTIEPMTLVTAADHAAQVIDGRVIRTKARWVENPRRIETVVTFGDVRLLKGDTIGGAEDGTFELVVPGGSIGPVQMRIAGAPELRTGDRWILFLLPTYKTHPIVGLTTGAFRVVESTDGTTEVRDAAGRAVRAVRSNGAVEVGGRSRVSSSERLVGTERARLRPFAQKATRPMTRDEFIAAVEPMLAESRPHLITHPAGRPEPAVLMPAPLRASQLERRERNPREAKSSRGSTAAPASSPAPDRRGR